MKKARDDLPGRAPRIAFVNGRGPRGAGGSRKLRDGEHAVLAARLIQERMPRFRFHVDRLAGVLNELCRLILETELHELREPRVENLLDRDLPDRTSGEAEAEGNAGSVEKACSALDVPDPVRPLWQFDR